MHSTGTIAQRLMCWPIRGWLMHLTLKERLRIVIVIVAEFDSEIIITRTVFCQRVVWLRPASVTS